MRHVGLVVFKVNRLALQDFDINRSQFLLITQNKKYKSQIGDERVIYVASSRHDSIDFNYRLMTIFDIMRVTYYKKYHFI